MTKFLKNADVTGYISQTSVTSSLLKTDANGKLVAAVAGTDYQTPGSLANADKLVREVYNKTGATLTKGTVVYINDGQGNLPAVTKAIATGDSTSAQTFGVIQSDITNNNNGYVVIAGGLDNMNTNGLGVGTALYLSSTTAGEYTTTKQSAPNHLVYIGVVVRDHPTQGVIEVRIQNGYELEELHNVSISSLANNHTLVWESATSLWKNKTIAAALGYTPADDAAVVKLTGNQTVAGVKTFTSALLANNPSEGATGEGLIAGQSFKIDATGTGQRAIMYVVSRTLSDTYGSGLIAQYANFDGDKAFGFNLNTAGGFELYVKNTTFNKALAIANTMAATFGSSVTATSFIKSGGTSAQFLKADGSVDSTSYMPSITFVSPLVIASGGEVSIGQAGASANGYLSSTDWNTFNNKLSASTAASTYLPLTGGTLTGDLTLSGTNPRLYFTDADNNPDYFISNTDGTFTVYDVTNSVGRFKIYSTGNAEFANGNLSIGTSASSNKLLVYGGEIGTQIVFTKDAPTGAYGRLGQDSNGTFLTQNAKWDGSSWTRDNTGGVPMALALHNGNGRYEFRIAANGANPISWTNALVIESNAAAAFSGNVTTGGSHTVNGTLNFAAAGNVSFTSNDASSYPRLTGNYASAQLGLFRTGSAVGGMYIGGTGTGFYVFDSSFNIRLLIAQNGDTAFNSSAVTVGGNQVWHAGNLTNLNQLTNGPGYLTSVTAHNQAWSTITSTPTTLSGYGISDATIISPEYTGSIGADGWYTIASYGSGRAVGTFHIYDDYSSRHNYVEAKVNWSFGHGGITIVNNGRYGSTTIRHIRLLYNTADQTYGGVKIQVYCINSSYTLRIRKEYPSSLTGWGAFTEITPVLENSPSGWTEYSRASEVTSERGSINTSSSVGYLAGNTILQSANYSSYALPLTGGVLANTGIANSPTLRINTSSSASFVHTQENFAANLTAGQRAVIFIGKEGSTKNSGGFGYYWAGAGSNSNFLTMGHWGNDDLLRIYGDGTVQATGYLRTAGITSNTVYWALGTQNAVFGNVLGQGTSTRSTMFRGNGTNTSVWWGGTDALGNVIPFTAIDATSGEFTFWRNSGGVGGGDWTKIMTMNASGLTMNSGDFVGNVTGSAASINGKLTTDGWVRTVSDSTQLQFYGNTRSMIYRTDGVTNPHGGGSYAHIFYYGSSGDSSRVFIVNTDGRLYSPYHGWIDTMSISGNAATATSLYGQGIIQRTSSGTSYSTMIQVRETSGYGGNTNIAYAPAIGFHWSGVVASSIRINAAGEIQIVNNPGTAYEAFRAGTISADSFSGAGTGLTGTASSLSIGGSAGSVAWENIGGGTRTNYTLRFQPPSSSYAGVQFLGTNAAGAGYLLIRGTSDSDIYTAEGITLVADQGWLTLAQRETAGKGVRIMTGTTSSTRVSITDSSTTINNTLTLASLASNDGMIENNTGGYFHLGGWGVGRTAATAILVNTAYRADIATNADNATTVAGVGITTIRGGIASNSISFYVNGDANTYYPVVLSLGGQFGMNRYSVTRGYSDPAPWDPIGTGAHKGGLTLTFDCSSDIAWGGNDKSWRIIQFSESYTTMVAGMALPVTDGIIVWLRGGGAYYSYQGPSGINHSATVYYGGYTAANGSVYAVRSNTSSVSSEITPKWAIRGYGDGDIYVNNQAVIHSGNIGSQSVSYATNSGQLGGYGNSNYLGKNGNSYFQQTTWIQSTATHGLYAPSSGAGTHWHPGISGSYGSWRIEGAKNSYFGIELADSYGTVVGMIDTGGNGGNWNTSRGWHFYFHQGNNCLALGGSTTSSSYKVVSNGNLRVDGLIYSSDYIQTSGAIYASGDITAYYSDGRLKENVQVIDSVLDKLSKIGGYSYTANNLALDLKAANDKKVKLGVIAQEVKDIFPEVIEQAPFDRDPVTGKSISGENYMTVKYERFVPVLIQGIKEQQVQIESQKTEIDELKELVKQLLAK